MVPALAIVASEITGIPKSVYSNEHEAVSVLAHSSAGAVESTRILIEDAAGTLTGKVLHSILP